MTIGTFQGPSANYDTCSARKNYLFLTKRDRSGDHCEPGESSPQLRSVTN